MTEYKSKSKIIPYSTENVFMVLSNLQKLDLVKDKIPQDKIKNFSYDKDSCSMNISPIGNVKFVITERLPNNQIKYKAEQLPFEVNLTLNIKEDSSNSSELELVVNANLNPFLKPMVSKPLQNGLDKAAEMLSDLPYSDLVNNKELE